MEDEGDPHDIGKEKEDIGSPKENNAASKEATITTITTTTATTKITLRTIKTGDPSAWAPIAANEEVSPESQSDKLKREMQQLVFYNPGPSTKDLLGFKPEFSNREKRKLNRLFEDKKGGSSPIEGKKKRGRRPSKPIITLYDNEGRLNDTGEDLCDCMILECPGCHFACPKCNSERCGSTCRSNRRWTYDVVYFDSK